ncbi:hypothetical protein GCM10007036_18730 [Alsobacter metallidurans]|uniref:Glycosyltransferase RgtA/B/C/D-like domain-containing protein n=1 Tax=Alsobacter metallidurans TaxID=340221 RepID=A0A917I6R5_9HYPH|nr:hypothetical protein [Alsobacter metallidurans]GGH17361.1 hypothetical protein GCM10007036_18730 [Alsobacter metallidurans]
MALKRWLTFAPAALCGGLTFAFLLATMPRDLNVFDEGIVLTNAMRMAAGELVHRDFYSSYGPAQYAIVAAVLGLFDGSFIAERIYDLAVKAAICTAVFSIGLRVCRLWVAGLASAVCAIMLAGSNSFLYPVFPCILLALAATSLLARPAIGQVGPLWPSFGAGLCAGFAALFRYDAGFFLLAANGVGVAVVAVLSDPWPAALRRTLAIGLAYAVGAAVVFLPAAVAFLSASPLHPFVHDIFEYTLRYYGPMRGLPFPAPWRSFAPAVYLPVVAAALAAFEVWRMSQREKASARAGWSALARAHLVLFGACALFLFTKGVVRVQPVHMLLGGVPGLVALAVVMDQWARAHSPARAYVLALFVVTAGVGSTYYEFGVSLSDRPRTLAGWLAQGAPTGACEGVARLKPAYARVATTLARRTRADEKILVALHRNDRILVNAMVLYAVARRLPATHWAQFDPGLQNRADIQAQMIDELRRGHVRFVVRDASFDSIREPNGSAQSSGVTALDDFLTAEYHAYARAGDVEIWIANTAETPPGRFDACEAELVQS